MDADRKRLLQDARRRFIENDLGNEPWLIVYSHERRADGDGGYFCALVPESHRAEAMSNGSWDLTARDGSPGFSGSTTDATYHRFGSSDEFEPLVLLRDFHGVKPAGVELSEEFRLFHNLYHDNYNNKYWHISSNGDEELACEVTEKLVRVKTRLIRQFLAARQMHLAVYFDFVELSSASLSDLKVSPQEAESEANSDRLLYRLDVYANRSREHNTASRLLGKKLIPRLPIADCGMWPFDKEPKIFGQFIIGVDESGAPVRSTCDPDQLNNYFGKMPQAPMYLTPVHFRKDVLRKYYDHPEKYSVGDGYISCGSLWFLRLDNDRDDAVIVFLGDLGGLAPEEQAYWQSFNVVPDGKLSETAWRRGFMAEPADPQRSDLLFKVKYIRLQEAWERQHGWRLFLPLHEDDTHAWKRLRVPLTDSQAEFDDLVLALVKVLIDSLNEKAIAGELVGGPLKDEKGIGKLDRFLESKGYGARERDIALLRTLQDVRSASTAHRKGDRFDRLASELKLKEAKPAEVFRRLLVRVNEMLDDLTRHSCQGDRA